MKNTHKKTHIHGSPGNPTEKSQKEERSRAPPPSDMMRS